MALVEIGNWNRTAAMCRPGSIQRQRLEPVAAAVSSASIQDGAMQAGCLRYKGPEFIGARSISQVFGLSNRQVMARTSSKVSRALSALMTPA